MGGHEPCRERVFSVADQHAVQQMQQEMRCDRCFTKHLRCDRTLPECQQCRRKPEAKCTYLRTVLRRRPSRAVCPATGPLVQLVGRARQSSIIHILTSLQYPCPRSAKGDFAILVEILTHGQKPLAVPALAPAGLAKGRATQLLERAQGAYFEYANPFMPLFTRQAFVARPRSDLLRSAVHACGLSWCGDDPLAKGAQDRLIQQLCRLLKPGAIRPSLDTLQGLLVVAVGMCGSPWVAVRSNYLHSLAIGVAHLLGLHVHRGGEERQLAANCLLYYLHFMGLGLLHIQADIRPTLPARLDPALVFAYALEHLNRHFPAILRLKLDVVTNPPCDSAHKISRLEAELLESSHCFLVRLLRLPRAGDLLPVLSFYHAFLVFFVASLALYRSTGRLAPSSQPPPSPALIREVATRCACALRWAQQIPSAYTHWNMFGKFSQCLLFLTKHAAHFDDNRLLHTSYAHLAAMATSPHYGAVGYTQYIVNLVGSHLS